MEQRGWEWLRKTRGRIDLSQDQIQATAFASERDLTVNAKGETVEDAFQALYAKVYGNKQLATIIRSLHTNTVMKAQKRLSNAPAIQEALRQAQGAEKRLEKYQESFEAAKNEVAQLAGLNTKAEISDDVSDEVKASAAQQFATAKADLESKKLELADFKKKATIARDASNALSIEIKKEARKGHHAKLYQGYLEAIGEWHNDE